MTPVAFAAEAGVSRETLARLEAYAALLVQWQSAINLVGADTLDDVWRRHMLDSAQLLAHIPADATTVTDLGSGAGFPGMVLAIAGGRPVHLIESVGKKATFLREVARITGATVTVHHGRIERQTPWASDVVTARALAPITLLLGYAQPFMALGRPPASCLILKGARAEEELTDASKSWTMAVRRFKSVTDPTGVILRIQDLARG